MFFLPLIDYRFQQDLDLLDKMSSYIFGSYNGCNVITLLSSIYGIVILLHRLIIKFQAYLFLSSKYIVD